MSFRDGKKNLWFFLLSRISFVPVLCALYRQNTHIAQACSLRIGSPVNRWTFGVNALAFVCHARRHSVACSNFISQSSFFSRFFLLRSWIMDLYAIAQEVEKNEMKWMKESRAIDYCTYSFFRCCCNLFFVRIGRERNGIICAI